MEMKKSHQKKNKIKKSRMNNNSMAFGMRIASRSILKEINNGCKNNLVLSPLSLHIALNMLASGSTGQTLEQLLGFLESDSITHLNTQSSLLMELATGDTQDGDVPPHDDDSIHENPKSGSKRHFPYFSQNTRDGPIICLVNGIWVDKSFPLKHSFKQLAEDVYKANAQSVDFRNKGMQVTEEINSWAREASKGHIDPLFMDPIQDAILVLANALYFKGTWVDSFKAKKTKDEDFHLLNGETVRVPFMKRGNTYSSYGSFEGFELLKMDYKCGQLENKEYAMYIFLPDKKDGLKELVEKFNSDPRFLLKNRELQHIELGKLWLPKLKYEYELDACRSMKELGLNLPFDAKKAEIKEIVETSEGLVYVSDAIQKAYIEVNEEGTVATAVTTLRMRCGYSMDYVEPPQVNFIADHPFLFMIKEEVSDTVLFVGAALNPLA